MNYMKGNPLKKKELCKKTCEIGEIVLVIILILIGILKFIE